ncbi:hypothetical protein AB835_12355 [Candidatus Endobugula sertula]|uniref:DUF3833 domain-containing protein n=1 Tax=Candidatus Endobugula sertula TaxID=62101 RepID=A0A1D2QMG3_9GAMM|nr:hypothetical protein AB835_12355 [Candidatus Endobugula sertula]
MKRGGFGRLFRCLLCLSFISLILSVNGCSSNTISHYSDNLPKLDIKKFFEGKLIAKGIVKNFNGKVIRYFNADLDANWQGDTGILREVFYFNDGEVEYRNWTLRLKDMGHFIGTAEDVIGEASGDQKGNAIFMNYVLAIPYSDTTIEVSVDDKMYLVTPDTLINESYLYKYGIKVGEVVLTIQKKH